MKKGKTETQLFETYLLNRRAIELNQRGIQTNFDIDAVAKEFVKNTNLKFEKQLKIR